MKEIWKKLPNYEDFYQVSNLGRYRNTSKRKGGYSRVTILKPKEMKDGYLMFRATKDGKQKLINAHRVIAELFIKNPRKCKEVNHKDSDRKNNVVSNLEWVTPKENIRHAIHNGNFKNSLKNLKKRYNIITT